MRLSLVTQATGPAKINVLACVRGKGLYVFGQTFATPIDRDLPWTPPRNPLAGRLINDIVLDEESDLAADGRALSHYESYLQAMQEVGADSSTIERWCGDDDRALQQLNKTGQSAIQSRQRLWDALAGHIEQNQTGLLKRAG